MSVEGRPLEEKELIADAKSGDASAYGRLVRLHQAVALRVAYIVVRDHAEAEDVTQEALVKAYRALGRFREDAPFRPWLLRIVRNEALNRRRSTGRRELLALRAAADPVSGGAAPSPETEVMSGEERERVLAAVDSLPERYRSVISARFLVGLSEAETAGMLGIASGTVKSRTSRGLTRLREMLGDRDD
ncbi:MAG TPA: RNA polymerase sigma factor [Acidimicrobiia bacterium]|nr:RNA polymerase sigma factor [Acidimicrobiia bacterium]